MLAAGLGTPFVKINIFYCAISNCLKHGYDPFFSEKETGNNLAAAIAI